MKNGHVVACAPAQVAEHGVAERCLSFDRKSYTRDWPRRPQSGHSPSPGSRPPCERSVAPEIFKPADGRVSRAEGANVFVDHQSQASVARNAAELDRQTRASASKSAAPAREPRFQTREPHASIAILTSRFPA